MSSFSSLKRLFLLLLMTYAMIFTHGVRAEDVPPELQGSGRPVPRFVTIDTNKAYVRSGPAPRYPVKLVYKKAGLPVEITQEFDVWRKIKDIDGDEGWINKGLLSDKRSVIIQSTGPIEMREGFSENSRIMANLENGVIARLQKCSDQWCQISAGGYQGWVERNFLWGLYPKEEIH